MSKCKVLISTQKTHYKLGETVKGQVTVEVDKECKCDGLVLKKYWSTHGKGNRSSGGREELNLFQGVWQPGIYTYAFSFVLDEGPYSYHGHYINVDWYLSARADIPWAIDAKDELEIILEKDEANLTDNIKGYEFHNNGEKVISIEDLGYFKYFPLIFVVVGLLLIVFAEAIIFGALFVLVGAYGFYKLIQSSIAERKLGGVECLVNEHNPCAGDRINFSVSFTPKSNIKINSASVKLLGQEVAVSGSGTNRTTHTHTFHDEKIPILAQNRFSRGMPVEDRHHIVIPENAAPSFRAPDNKIEWSLVVEIDIPRWPDWVNSLSITVKP